MDLNLQTGMYLLIGGLVSTIIASFLFAIVEALLQFLLGFIDDKFQFVEKIPLIEEIWEIADGYPPDTVFDHVIFTLIWVVRWGASAGMNLLAVTYLMNTGAIEGSFPVLATMGAILLIPFVWRLWTPLFYD